MPQPGGMTHIPSLKHVSQHDAKESGTLYCSGCGRLGSNNSLLKYPYWDIIHELSNICFCWRGTCRELLDESPMLIIGTPGALMHVNVHSYELASFLDFQGRSGFSLFIFYLNFG